MGTDLAAEFWNQDNSVGLAMCALAMDWPWTESNCFCTENILESGLGELED